MGEAEARLVEGATRASQPALLLSQPATARITEVSTLSTTGTSIATVTGSCANRHRTRSRFTQRDEFRPRGCPWQRHCLLQSLSALLLLAIRKPVSRRVSRPVSIS